MESGSIDDNTALVRLAGEVGKVAGAMEVLVGEVSSMRGDISSQNEQLAVGTERMSAIESQVSQLVTQVKTANGRTSKLEALAERTVGRVVEIERWRSTITFLPRMFDKLAARPFWGAVLLMVVAGVAGAAIERFL